MTGMTLLGIDTTDSGITVEDLLVYF